MSLIALQRQQLHHVPAQGQRCADDDYCRPTGKAQSRCHSDRGNDLIRLARSINTHETLNQPSQRQSRRIHWLHRHQSKAQPRCACFVTQSSRATDASLRRYLPVWPRLDSPLREGRNPAPPPSYAWGRPPRTPWRSTERCNAGVLLEVGIPPT
jgi:hypothetical protein